MMADRAALPARLADGDIHAEPLTETHCEGLRAACAGDEDFWPLYPRSFGAGHFDASFDGMIHDPGRVPFALFARGGPEWIAPAPFTSSEGPSEAEARSREGSATPGLFLGKLETGFSTSSKRTGGVSSGECRSVLIGMSGYLNIDAENDGLEIGGTYLTQAARGAGLNARFKRLFIDHALACGFQRIEFRIDTRNTRSQAAVAKLGAVREGVLRRHKRLWTGYVRDTVVFSILAEEWELWS